MMNIEEYKERVIDHFKADLATENEWKLLGQLFLNASENGTDNLEEFDKHILTTQEFQELYHTDETGKLRPISEWNPN